MAARWLQIRSNPRFRRSIYRDLGMPGLSVSEQSSGRRCVDAARKGGAKLVKLLTVSVRRPPWSLLKTQWLDVPIPKPPPAAADQARLIALGRTSNLNTCHRTPSQPEPE